MWVNRNGTEQSLAAPARAYLAPRISPDGRRLAVEIDDQVWLFDFSQETLTRLTFEGANGNPSWTPDGKRIAFQSDQNILFWQLADGGGGREPLTNNKLTQSSDSWSPDSWSPDGQLLAFTELDPTTGRDIWVLPMRFTCSLTQALGGSGKSRRKAARSPCGTGMAGNCSTAAATK